MTAFGFLKHGMRAKLSFIIYYMHKLSSKVGYFRSLHARACEGDVAQVYLLEKAAKHPCIEARRLASAQITFCCLSPLPQAQCFDVHVYKNGREIQRCGHGFLAAAAFLFAHEGCSEVMLRSGNEQYRCTQEAEDSVSVTLPYLHVHKNLLDEGSSRFLGLRDQQRFCWETEDPRGYRMVQLEDPQEIYGLEINPSSKLDERALVVTSIHPEHDFVFRYFAPQYGELESPATGSVQSALGPYWATKLKKTRLTAVQASPGGALMQLEVVLGSVRLQGRVQQNLDPETILR